MAAAIFLYSPAKAQNADEVISKHIAAIGGADNWKKINSMTMTGAITAQGAELPITITKLNNKGQKMEMTFNGMSNYQMYTPTEGWTYFPAFGQPKPEAMTAEDLKQEADDLDIAGPLIDYKAKGNKVTYLGKDEVEGTECHKLKVTHKNGKEETVFFDVTNFYEIRAIQKATVNGKEVEQTVNFSNFKKLPEGIVFPMSVDQGQGVMAIKNVEINKAIAESTFKPSSADLNKAAGK